MAPALTVISYKLVRP